MILQFFTTSTTLSFLHCYIMNSRDVHDESSVDSLLCLLLDLLGNAKQHGLQEHNVSPGL